MTDPFKILGLKRGTATQADVKRAYAKKLKETRPEDDRAGFMELRQAFTTARSIAKGNDAQRAEEADPDDQPLKDTASEDASAEAKEAPAPPPKPAKDVTWKFHKDINWNVCSNAQGQLILKTLRWMKAGGPKAEAFVEEFKTSFITNPEIDRAEVAGDMLSFLQVQGNKDDTVYDLQDWEDFEISRPDWLSDDLIALLRGPLGLFDHTHSEAWRARTHNVVLALFQSLDPERIERADAPQRQDAKALFEQQQTEQRGDEHGSFFDREKMEWVDMSPVSVAIRDIQAEIDRGLWDVAQKVKPILAREALQPLDEFQDLDARMRGLICDVTGQYQQKKAPNYPAWLTKDMVSLLEETFGWSHQYGRHEWERRQFDWLHRVLSRDVEIERPAAQFKAQHIAGRPRPTKPNPIAVALAGLYAKPYRLLLGYLGFRVLQFLARLVV